MTGCCGGRGAEVQPDENKDDKGIVVERKCRDVLFLLIFIAWWGGMLYVCVAAFQQGDPRRLVYSLDSAGMLCGTENVYKNKTYDLTKSTNLYYLNPLELLDRKQLYFAKAVCVPACPNITNTCPPASLPCKENAQYTCPYYAFAEDGLYGSVAGSPKDTGTYYWGNLANSQVDGCKISNKVLGAGNSSFFSSVGLTKGAVTCGNNGSTYNVSGAYYQVTSMYPGEGPCYPNFVETVEYFHRCFPKFPPEYQATIVGAALGGSASKNSSLSAYSDWFQQPGNRLTQYISDISKGILIIIVAGLVGGIVLSMVWLLVLRYFAGFMAWFTIVVVNLLLIGVTLWSWNMAGYLATAGEVGQKIASQLPTAQDPTEQNRKVWLYIAIAVTVITVLIFIITLLIIRRVRVAIACMKVASQAIGSMPSILFFPILPFMFVVGLVIYWVAITAVLWSAGEVKPHYRTPSQTYQPVTFQGLFLNFTGISAPPPPPPPPKVNLTDQQLHDNCIFADNCYFSVDWNYQLKYMFIYHLFGLLWTANFIIGFSLVTIACAIGSYYWARGDTAAMPRYPVMWGMRTTAAYHLGSIALASFIIAVIQLIRLALEYIDRKTKEIQKTNQAAGWIMKCCKCYMWCVEQIVKFINRNAYIMVACKGYNYCRAATRAVVLIITNAVTLAIVNTVGDLLIFLGKLSVAVACGLIAFAMSSAQYYNDPTKYPDTYLSSPVFPIAISVGVGFFVAKVFLGVYEMAVDTILLCFCEDSEMNDGEPRYAPPLLMDALGKRPGAPKPDGKPSEMVPTGK